MSAAVELRHRYSQVDQFVGAEAAVPVEDGPEFSAHGVHLACGGQAGLVSDRTGFVCQPCERRAR